MPDNSALSALLDEVRRGDEAAFSALSEQYRPLTESMAVRYAAKADAEQGLLSVDDFRQEAGLALYRAALSFDREQTDVSFGLFAKVCVRNAMVSLLRRASRVRQMGDRERLAAAAEKTADRDPLSRLVSRETHRSLVERALGVLSPYELTIFEQYIAGRSPREIAEQVGRPVKSVNNAVCRIKAKLKGLLRDSN